MQKNYLYRLYKINKKRVFGWFTTNQFEIHPKFGTVIKESLPRFTTNQFYTSKTLPSRRGTPPRFTTNQIYIQNQLKLDNSVHFSLILINSTYIQNAF